MGPRTLQRLTALSISREKKAGYHADGGGLYLQVTAAHAKSWIYRFAIEGRRREMGLGPYPAVSLAAARKAAASARSLVKEGQDPIAERKAVRARKRLDDARGVTFDKAAELFIADNEAAWRSEPHRAQWRISLKTYASPTIGDTPVRDIDSADIIRILQPLWRTKVETASRLRNRMERVLDWAKVQGYRVGENPARWRGHLDKVLPALKKVHKAEHHAAVHIDDVAAVYTRLRDTEGMGAMTLRYDILTVSRPGEVVGMKWPELDSDNCIWTVPGERTKSGRNHRVPLSSQAMEIIEEMRKIASGDLVFPGWAAGKPMALKVLRKALRNAGGGSATVHGFRSTFKEWGRANRQDRELTELSMAHQFGNEVERAYGRHDLLEERRPLMQAWANFISLFPNEKVVSIRGGRRG